MTTRSLAFSTALSLWPFLSLALPSCGAPPPPLATPPPTLALAPPLAPAAPLTPPPALAPAPSPALADPDQKIADLSTCMLESGQRIDDCRIGYRTFGKLDATKSNVVLFPTWFSGTTKPLVDVVPDKLVDTKRFFLILVDAAPYPRLVTW